LLITISVKAQSRDPIGDRNTVVLVGEKRKCEHRPAGRRPYSTVRGRVQVGHIFKILLLIRSGSQRKRDDHQKMRRRMIL
jgi:hypothetical protein